MRPYLSAGKTLGPGRGVIHSARLGPSIPLRLRVVVELVEYDEGVPFSFGGQLLPVGSQAPDFQLPDETGNIIRLSDFHGGRPVVLVFYVMDATPG